MCPVHRPGPDEVQYPQRHFLQFLDKVPPARLRIITIVVPFIFLIVLSVVPMNMEPAMQYTLAILVCVSMLWTFGMVPLAVTAMLVPVLLAGFGIFTPVEALAPFADPVVYLLVGGLIIAETFRKNGMDKRLAYFLVNAAEGDLKRTLGALMISAALISMWISNTATVALLIPVALSVASQAGEHKKKVAGLFLIGISMATAFGSLSTIIGSPTNAITSALLAKEITWTFTDWLIVGVPVAVSCVVLVFLVLPMVLPPPAVGLDLSETKSKMTQMGPMRRMEKVVLLVFGATVLLWVIGPQIAEWTGVSSGLMNTGIIALLSAAVMFLVGAVEWDDAKNIAWDVLLIIGAGLALGEALEATGAAQWLAEGMASFTGGYSLILTMVIFAIISFILTTVLSNTATAALLVPIAISTSAALNIDPKYLALTVGMVASISLITPVGTPPATLAYSTGNFSRKELAKSGLAVGIPAMFIIVAIVFIIISVGLI